MNRRNELLARYFADLSKIIFAVVVLKQLVEKRFDIVEFVIGLIGTFIMLLSAYFVHPKE